MVLAQWQVVSSQSNVIFVSFLILIDHSTDYIKPSSFSFAQTDFVNATVHSNSELETVTTIVVQQFENKVRIVCSLRLYYLIHIVILFLPRKVKKKLPRNSKFSADQQQQLSHCDKWHTREQQCGTVV